MPLTCHSLILGFQEVSEHILESVSFWLLMSTLGPCDNQSSTQFFPKTELTHMMTTKICSILYLLFFLLLLALVLHHHFRLTRSFGTDSDIVSQAYIPTLKVYLEKIVEFRRALIERSPLVPGTHHAFFYLKVGQMSTLSGPWTTSFCCQRGLVDPRY